MTENDRTHSGIEDTARRDPLIHLVGSMGDPSRYITDMEAAGQTQVVQSEYLPVRMNSGTDEDLIAMGFTLGGVDPGDALFRKATLPAGWVKRPGEHSMWSEIVDQHQRVRVSIFYKAAFYDRSAHMSVKTVDGYAYDLLYGAPMAFDEWATAEAVRASLMEQRQDLAEQMERYGATDNFYDDRLAAVDEVLGRLPGGES